MKKDSEIKNSGNKTEQKGDNENQGVREREMREQKMITNC